MGCTMFVSAHAQPSDTLSRIDEIFTHWNNATPGGSVLVSPRNGSVIYHKKAFGLADLEHNVPNTTETIFEGGSVSKQFTAASILLLATEGKLSAQDDVRKPRSRVTGVWCSDYNPAFTQSTSGLKRLGFGRFTDRLAQNYTCLYAGACTRHHLQNKSHWILRGTEYSYSNSNYTLLVTIVARVRNVRWPNLPEPDSLNHWGWRTRNGATIFARLFRIARLHTALSARIRANDAVRKHSRSWRII